MRAINASAMRQYNRRMLLNEIRRQPVSRAELAERTHLTRASVTQIIEELIGEGLVVEGASVERSRLGRRSTLLNINPSAGAILGVNLSRGQCDVGAVDLLGTVLRHRALPVPGRSADDLLDEIAELLAGLRRELAAEGFRVFAAGFCAPGPLEPRTGLMLNPPNFKAWHGVNVAQALRDRLDLPVYLENVANAHALAEKYFGVANDAENFVLIRVDEGVGAGLFVRGGLYRGAHNYAAEFGHLSVDINGPMCVCGNRGCLEKYVSIPALLKDTPYSSWRELRAHRDEPSARAAEEQLVRYMSHGIVSIVNAFDVEKVVLAGELAEQADDLIDRINAEIARRTIFALDEAPVVAGRPFQPVQMGAMPAYTLIWNRDEEAVLP